MKPVVAVAFVLAGLGSIGCSPKNTDDLSKAGPSPAKESGAKASKDQPLEYSASRPVKIEIPPQKPMSEEEQIAAVKKKGLRPWVETRMIREIRKQHGHKVAPLRFTKPKTTRSMPPATKP